MGNRSQITALPPTITIKDPATRAFLDALVNAWDARSGTTDKTSDDRFVTAGEFRSMASQAVADAFAPGVIGGANGTTSGAAVSVTNMIDRMAESIRQSIIYQLLETQIKPIDLERLRGRIDGLLSDLRTGLSAIVEESETRATQDTALARAIVTLWSSIGGSDAIIQEGDYTEVNPYTAVATKWDQVVAAVTDPNTGEVDSASIRQQLDAYANGANDTFNALYTLRAQVSAGGQTVVGGFGLAATDGAGSDEGPTIDMGVLANRFFIAAPAGEYDPAADWSVQNNMPFIVVTTPTTINGVVYPPGVYMKQVAIGDASIDTAKIYYHLRSNNFDGTFAADGAIATPGTAGWAIDKSGYGVFSNIRVRGTSTVDRLVVTGAQDGSVFVPNNGTATVTHGENRNVILSVWSPVGAAVLTSMDANSFTVRVDFAGDATCYYHYF